MSSNPITTTENDNQFTNDFIVDDQEEPQSPEPEYMSEAFQGFEDDFRSDTIFIIDIESDSKPPGTLSGEKIPENDIANNSYDFLYSHYPHWRRLLSDDYMRSTILDNSNASSTTKKNAPLLLLHIDDHAWASVVHYMAASKFAQTLEIYTKFSLDSGDAVSRLPVPNIKLLSQKLPISKEAAKDWYENRKLETKKRALLAKFAQNEDLKTALILTGYANLVDKSGKSQYALMWVRAVLRSDHQQEQKQEHSSIKQVTSADNAISNTVDLSTRKLKDEKHIEELLRVIEGMFGKDKQHILTSILNGTNFLSNNTADELSPPPAKRTKVEPKTVDVKDAMGYLEQLKKDEPLQTYNTFLKIMTDFRSEKINTPQVLERVTLLFKGKPWLIRNFLMFLPPGYVLDPSSEAKLNLIYINSPTGKKITVDSDKGTVTFDQA